MFWQYCSRQHHRWRNSNPHVCFWLLPSRWVAHGGKQDRCQLGSCEQIDRPDHIVRCIEEAVQSSVEPCIGVRDVGQECIEDNLNKDVEICSHFLREGGPSELEPDTQAALFQLGQTSIHLAHVLRQGGYNAVKKFPDEFDTIHAARAAVLLFTDFLAQAYEACRRDLEVTVSDICTVTSAVPYTVIIVITFYCFVYNNSHLDLHASQRLYLCCI